MRDLDGSDQVFRNSFSKVGNTVKTPFAPTNVSCGPRLCETFHGGLLWIPVYMLFYLYIYINTIYAYLWSNLIASCIYIYTLYACLEIFHTSILCRIINTYVAVPLHKFISHVPLFNTCGIPDTLYVESIYTRFLLEKSPPTPPKHSPLACISFWRCQSATPTASLRVPEWPKWRTLNPPAKWYT